MTKFYILTKVLLRNGSGMQASGKKRKNLGLIVLLIAFLPFICLTTGVIYASYGTLEKYGLSAALLSGLQSSASVAMVVFGVLYVISIYYFTDDTVTLLTLPLKPQTIIASKFVIACIYQYILEALIVLPGIIAYAARIHTVLFLLYSLVILITLPVIPTVVCSIICILLMAFGRFFRNKDRVKLIVGLLSIAAAIGINVGIQAFTGSLSAGDAQKLLSQKEMFNQVTAVFPPARLSVNALMQSGSLAGLLNLIGFLAVCAASFLILLAFGRGLYLRGVVGLTQSTGSSRRMAAKEYQKLLSRSSSLSTLAVKDWRILVRTPAYLINCVVSGILFPPLMVFLFGFTALKVPIPSNGFTVVVGALLLSFFCILNLSSPTAISREGKDFYLTRYIPVPYRTQVKAKLLPGLFMSWGSATVVAVLSLFVLKIHPLALLLLYIGSLLIMGAMNATGLLFDILSPKLEWDDETAAVKRNYNFFIELIMEIVLFVVLLIPVAAFHMNLFASTVLLYAVGAALFAWMYRILLTKGVQMFSGYNSGFYKKYIGKNEPKSKVELWRKHGGKIVGIAAAAIFILAVGGLLLEEFTTQTKVTITEKSVSVKGGVMESCSFATGDITSVALKDSMPSTSKINGFNGGSIERGWFEVEGMGKGNVYVQSGKGPFLFVRYKGGFLILNYSDSAKTKSVYSRLQRFEKAG